MKTIILADAIELKRVTYQDAEGFFRVIDRERTYLRKWLTFVDHLTAQEHVEGYLTQHFQTPLPSRDPLMVIHVENEFAGLIGFKQTDRANKRTEIGYWLSQSHQNKGIMTLALKQMLWYAFEELGMNRVQLKIAVGNIASLKLGQRLGFRLEGIERDGELLITGFSDVYLYSMLKREFTHRNSSR